MSNLFSSAFRPRFDVDLTLHAPTREPEIWSGIKLIKVFEVH